ncbi:hypothetical protein [Thalassotalea sp. ND16A]|uniref:hypothetical protein n=1 Tax=Thalassotalea sp. ND16A TaxID=1535422 RepID=UPI00051A0C5C|nr:hypothetical protein [Thalassotalea sp. ND16A]KGJ98937.1 hypothetical protein ND16A_0459 [Thalassotalea sp. ND16A]
MTKTRINLLKDELIAVQSWLTLTNVVRVWAVFFSIFALYTAYLNITHTQFNDEYIALKRKNVQLKNKLKQYQQVLDNRTISSKKINQLSTLKFIFQNKQILHRQLTDHSQLSFTGFAGIMSELAINHHGEISLKNIKIDNDNFSVSGLAPKAESVPIWLSGFEGAAFMSGRNFAQLNLSVNEKGDTQFVVSSKQSAAEGSH